MAVSIDYSTFVIFVPQADLTPLGGGVFQLDLDAFRLELKGLEESEAGMPFPDTHQHNTTVTVAGTVLARVVEIINGYTVEFEDGQYAVNLIGANSNVAEVAVVNQVSIRSFNTAGLIEVGTGLDATQTLQLTEVHQRHALDAAVPVIVDRNAQTITVGGIVISLASVGGVDTYTRSP